MLKSAAKLQKNSDMTEAGIFKKGMSFVQKR